jgi:Skp family chaperone for outer membrane proteins
MRSFVVIAALSLVLGSAPTFAQGTQTPQSPAPAQTTPTITPPQTTPGPTNLGQTNPGPPRPFPQGAKFAFINIQRVAGESTEGKASTAKVQALNQQKVTQLNDLNKKLQADQAKLQQQTSVMSEAARDQLQRDIDREQKEVQRFTQDAQEEVQQLQQDLQGGFQSRLLPVIQQVVAERGLEILFSQNDSGIVWADSALDITNDVIKRFDAAAPAGTSNTPPAPATAAPAPAATGTTTPPAARPPAGTARPPAAGAKPPGGTAKPPQD